MAKRHIRDKTLRKTGVIRTPDVTAVPDNDRTPTFSFAHLEKGYCIQNCEKEEKAHLADTLRKMGKLKWSELLFCNRHGLGCEKIPRKAIQVGIPSIAEKENHFIAFRFSGMKPMIGWRNHELFQVIWIDPKLKVYKH